MSARIYVDESLDLVLESTGPGGSRSLLDRQSVLVYASKVRAALKDFAKRTDGDINDVNVGIAGGTLSLADLESSVAASALGRLGGSAKSKAKTESARANGAKGGRPKKAK